MSRVVLDGILTKEPEAGLIMCDCIEKINKLLSEKKGTEVNLAVILTLKGSYPYMYAEYGEKKLTVKPTFCPFCGIKYLKDRKT